MDGQLMYEWLLWIPSIVWASYVYYDVWKDDRKHQKINIAQLKQDKKLAIKYNLPWPEDNDETQ